MRIELFNPVALVLLLIVAVISINNPVKADTGVKIGSIPISYGYVYAARLSDLSSTNNHASYDLLMKRQFAEAIPGLEKELAQHPDSLVAYVGLMQAEPTRRPDEIKHLQAKIAQQCNNHQEPKPADLFKLGTLLYYQLGQNPPPPHDFQPLAEAQTLLRQAWQHDHAPIIGLMLTSTLIYFSDPAIQGLNAKTINLQMLKELGGPAIYAKYIHAEQFGWDAEIPTVSLVPPQNLRPLLGIISSLYSLSARRTGILKVVNGKPKMINNPVPTSQISEENYFKRWYDNLKAAQKS